MLIAEPYKLTVNSCFLIYQDNPWDKRSMNKNVNEILEIEGEVEVDDQPVADATEPETTEEEE